MDDLVRQALAKWPNVPDCTGWLALDARGRWRVGEAGADASGRGRQTITHAAMIAFINRNYFPDDAGRWLFQNGPQRVFVELEYTPLVWRLVPHEGNGWGLIAHTGLAASAERVWLDEAGRFLIEACAASADANRAYIGVLHDHDTNILADALCDENGKALGADADARITALLSNPADTTPIALTWPRRDDSTPTCAAALFPIARIASADVPKRFGFDPHPAVSQGQMPLTPALSR